MKALGGRSGTEVIPLIVDSCRRICERRRSSAKRFFRYNPVFSYRDQGERMNTRGIRRSLAVWTMLTPLVLLAASSGPQVKTVGGVVEGKEDGAVHAFLGIPYGAPPVGDLRWKAPAGAPKWSGVRKATEFGPHCMQGNVYGDMSFRDPGGSEDCLSLNVWVPAKTSPGAKLPVMVWIYGG